MQLVYEKYQHFRKIYPKLPLVLLGKKDCGNTLVAGTHFFLRFHEYGFEEYIFINAFVHPAWWPGVLVQGFRCQLSNDCPIEERKGIKVEYWDFLVTHFQIKFGNLYELVQKLYCKLYKIQLRCKIHCSWLRYRLCTTPPSNDLNYDLYLDKDQLPPTLSTTQI